MAAFHNHRGGYIVFGIKDSPRKIVGLKNDNFERFPQERFTESINALFSPAIDWETGIITINQSLNDQHQQEIKIGWIYTKEGEYKPTIAQKANNNEKINNGDIFYRYRARTEKIKYPELNGIIENRINKDRENLIKILETIKNTETVNLGIINYSTARLTTPYGVDAIFDKKLVTQVLKKAKFIHEGSFNETEGIPVLKITGNLDLAEEIPVPEGDPETTHPYIQKQLAENLKVTPNLIHAMIWYYKMKNSIKYHLEISTSKNGKAKVHKFSEFALKYLKEKLHELQTHPDELEKILTLYKKELATRRVKK